jgi:hypothetical protein
MVNCVHLKEPYVYSELHLVHFEAVKPNYSFMCNGLHLTALKDCLLLSPDSKNSRDCFLSKECAYVERLVSTPQVFGT